MIISIQKQIVQSSDNIQYQANKQIKFKTLIVYYKLPTQIVNSQQSIPIHQVMSSLLTCSLSGSPVIQGVINKQTGHIYEKSTILCHLKTYHTCPHTGGALSESDLLPIITGQSNTLLTQSRSIAEMLEQLGNEYDSLVLEGFVSKEELQKVREELAVSLYQQDAALRVIAKLKSQIQLKREEVVRLMDQVRLRANSTA